MHLVLADDHKLVLDALMALLKKLRPEIEISKATDFDQALTSVSSADALDLVVLDVNMPGMNGLEGLKTMKQRFPELPVILLSGQGDPRLVRDALSNGAAGFIPKDLAGEAMLRALELVLSGETYVPTIALSDTPTRTPYKVHSGFGGENPLERLTRRESQVLALLVHGQSNKEIARELGLKDVTVAFHMKGIFQKLQVSNRTEAVSTALSLGLSV